MLLILATKDYSVGLGGGMYNQLGIKALDGSCCLCTSSSGLRTLEYLPELEAGSVIGILSCWQTSSSLRVVT